VVSSDGGHDEVRQWPDRDADLELAAAACFDFATHWDNDARFHVRLLRRGAGELHDQQRKSGAADGAACRVGGSDVWL